MAIQTLLQQQQQQQIPISANENRLGHQFTANQLATPSGGILPASERARPTAEPIAHSTQSYWLEPEHPGAVGQCRSAADCSSNGVCDSGSCACFAGFSAPTCAKGKQSLDELLSE